MSKYEGCARVGLGGFRVQPNPTRKFRVHCAETQPNPNFCMDPTQPNPMMNRLGWVGSSGPAT